MENQPPETIPGFMMGEPKIFILLPDGVGLRNFAYTDFYENARKRGLDVIFWNNTPFDLSSIGIKEIPITGAKAHHATDILKKARVQIDLNLNIKRENDTVYDSYRFPYLYRNFNDVVKVQLIRLLVLMGSSAFGVRQIRQRIVKFERKTPYYKRCLETLKKEKPKMILCTNQRTVSAIAPMLAASDLGIPTATVIFSWDNLPKATLVLEPDFYFVWSDHMKKELLHYYPYINESQVIVTGTPQFEPHAYQKIQSKESFFAAHNLNLERKYICYSGDDITTSPNDPQYLHDTAKAVNKLNSEGHKLGIIFRRCPADFSSRYDEVLREHQDIITAIDPKWEKIGSEWNTILPTKADLDLLINTIAHTEMVINLGSSMVFDYISFGKPCAYINYDVENGPNPNWRIQHIYKFVHFRSMPSPESVFWINSAEMIPDIILLGLKGDENITKNAKRWFEKINLHPTNEASQRILNAIEKIIEN